MMEDTANFAGCKTPTSAKLQTLLLRTPKIQTSKLQAAKQPAYVSSVLRFPMHLFKRRLRQTSEKASRQCMGCRSEQQSIARQQQLDAGFYGHTQAPRHRNRAHKKQAHAEDGSEMFTETVGGGGKVYGGGR